MPQKWFTQQVATKNSCNFDASCVMVVNQIETASRAGVTGDRLDGRGASMSRSASVRRVLGADIILSIVLRSKLAKDRCEL